jgi:DNA-binding CsgD family transcriptional regulator
MMADQLSGGAEQAAPDGNRGAPRHPAGGAAADVPVQRPSPTELPGTRLGSFGTIAPAVIFALITICIGADLLDDFARNESAGHLAGMTIGTLLSMTGLVLMLRILRASRAQVRKLETALDRTRADSIRWRDQAGHMLQGIGALIDEQFAEWGLSPSEREVGLLLLKGLSLKSIAAARSSSEATVRQQAQAVYRKAKLTGRAELAAFFLEDLLLPQDPSARNTPPPVAPAKTARA